MRPRTTTTSCSGSCAPRALDWAGFFPFSIEDGTAAAELDGVVDADLAAERLRECTAVQEPITDAARDALIGETIAVLVDEPDADGGIVGRTHREAPEIDGVVRIADAEARPGAVVHAARDGRGRSRSRRRSAASTGGRTMNPPLGQSVKRFGPGALATPANFITLGAAPLRDPDARADPARR